MAPNTSPSTPRCCPVCGRAAEPAELAAVPRERMRLLGVSIGPGHPRADGCASASAVARAFGELGCAVLKRTGCTPVAQGRSDPVGQLKDALVRSGGRPRTPAEVRELLDRLQQLADHPGLVERAARRELDAGLRRLNPPIADCLAA